MNKKICAITVTFNPNLEGFEQLLKSTLDQVDFILIVDNGSSSEILSNLKQKVSDKILLIALPANMGIATALNQGILYAIDHQFTHVLLLDHDSVPGENMVANLLNALTVLEASGQKIAAVGPTYTDVKTMAVMPFVQFGWWKHQWIKLDDNAKENFIYPDMLITSGTLIPTSAFQVVGMMDSALFIDSVDYDWCFRALAKGMKLVGVKEAKMMHNLGDSVFKLSNKTIPVHSSKRLYYITRNALLLYKRPYTPKKWILHSFIALLKQLVAFSLLIPPKKKNFQNMMLGIKDGLLGKGGQ